VNRSSRRSAFWSLVLSSHFLTRATIERHARGFWGFVGAGLAGVDASYCAFSGSELSRCRGPQFLATIACVLSPALAPNRGKRRADRVVWRTKLAGFCFLRTRYGKSLRQGATAQRERGRPTVFGERLTTFTWLPRNMEARGREHGAGGATGFIPLAPMLPARRAATLVLGKRVAKSNDYFWTPVEGGGWFAADVADGRRWW
jgi:hypothetical protein